ncbi:MAG: hypothetical protein HP049_02935 [Clostridiales bacterium]|nr:hypothetical protein [Clostridiales bacterium]
MAAFSDAVYKRRVQPDAVPLGRKYVLQISAEPMKEKQRSIAIAMLRLYLMDKKTSVKRA